MARSIVLTSIFVLELRWVRGFVAPTTGKPMSMSSAPRDRTQVLQSYEMPKRLRPFETVTVVGGSLDAAFAALGDTISARGGYGVSGEDTGQGSNIQRVSSSSMGLVFYSDGAEKSKSKVQEESDSGGGCVRTTGDVQGALASLHEGLPFLDNILASPVVATASTLGQTIPEREEGEASRGGGGPCVYSATLVLINSPQLKITPFALESDPSPNFPSTAVQRGVDQLKIAVAEAVQQSESTIDGDVKKMGCDGCGRQTPSASCRGDGEYDAVCLAFAGQSDSHRGYGEQGLEFQLDRLNDVIRNVTRSSNPGNICDGTSSFSCPLIASASPEVTAYGPTLSTRDHQTGDLSVIRAGVVGAMLHCTGSNSDNASDKLTTATTVDDVRSFFRVVHAGNHMPIRGSQFRVKRMQGSDILAEVMPIQAPATTPLQTIDPPQQPLLWGAAVLEEDAREDAASWCRDSVLSSTFFEKLAVQTSLGVGILRRTDTTTTIPSHESDASSTLQTPAPIEPPAGGLVPVFPAATCIHISEVDPERGLLRLASVPHWHLASPRSASEGDGSQAVPASRGETSTQHAAGGCCSALPVSSLGSLRPGDLCDFRAVGPMATMQAERDAYAWFHASRLSARISSSTSSAAPPPAMEHGGIQGCFAAGAASRFGERHEQEGCDDIVRSASGHGDGCPTLGVVPAMQFVSMDNMMFTSSAESCLANVFFCEERR